MGIELNKVIASAVSSAQADGVDIHFVDPTAAFSGHEICWLVRYRAEFRFLPRRVAGEQAAAQTRARMVMVEGF